MVLRMLLSWLLCLTAVLAQGSGLSQEYCSSQNTGDSYQGVYNQYQSNGACKTQCQDSYAFAIVQGAFCWCSNYIPSSTTDLSKCNDKCPGYPTDLCGNVASGLFGYIALNIPPVGIVGAARTTTSVSDTPWTQDIDPALPMDDIILARDFDDSSSTQYYTGTTSTTTTAFTRTFFTRTTSSSTSLPTPPPSPQTTSLLTVLPQAPSSSTSSSSTSQPQAETVSQVVVQTVTESGDITTVVSYVTPQSSSTSTSASSTTASLVTSAIVVTVSGAVITQTVTSTPIPNSAQDASYTVQQQGLSAGAIAGIVIGVVAGLLAVLLAAFLVYHRRQRRKREEAVAAAAAGRAMAEKKAPPKRNTSVLSRSGLLGGGGAAHDAETNPFDEPGNGTASQRASMLFGAGAAAEAHSPLGSSHSDGSRRHSKPMVYDQRLNPSALFGGHDNGSRVSMQDGADYSRTLGVTNPDPRASWESRVSR